MFWVGVIVGWTVSSILCAIVLSSEKSSRRREDKRAWNVW